MIYLENTTQSQKVYIPRQVIQTATTREINIITSGDVINIVDSKLEDYYTSAETDTQIENAIAAESARCEETYAKIEDIPDVSDFVTSADVKTQVEDYNYVNSADVKTQIEDYHYITSGDVPDFSEFITSGQAQEQINQSLDGYATEQWVEDKHYLTEHQSLSAYSTTEQMNSAISAATDDMATKTWVGEQGYLTEHQSLSAYSTTEQVEGMIANESARTEETYAKKSDVPDVNNYYTSAETNTVIENAIAAESARCEETYAKPADIPDVSNFVTSADVKSQVEDYNYVNSADVETQIEEKNYVNSGAVQTQIDNSISGITERINEVEEVTSIAINDLNNKIPDVSDFVTSADVKTQVEEYNYVNSGQVKTQIEDYHYITSSDLPDVSNFVTSADVKTQVEEYNYVNSGDVKTQINNNLSAYTKTSGFATINGSAITEGGDIVIEGGGGVDSGLTERVDEIEEVTSIALNELNTRFSSYTPTSGFATINGSGITDGGNLVIQGGGGSSYTAGDGIDITNDVISVTGRQETLVSGTNIKTINNQSLLGSGNIDIQGGSGGSANIIELTQAEYNALSAYQQDALYVISDAEEVDLNNYATSGDIQTLSGQIQTLSGTIATVSGAVGNKVDKINTTASSSGYKFPKWNDQGQITGSTEAYQASFNINGGSRTIYSTSSSAMPTVYAPTTTGSAGQPLLSNGSGAPVWASFKFWFGTETQYNAITTKDSSTIYFVKPD